MSPSPRGAARAYSRRPTLLHRLLCILATCVVAMMTGPIFAWAQGTLSARGHGVGGRHHSSSYVDDWKRLRDALNNRSKPRESAIAAPPPTKEAMALAEPRIISPEEVDKLANSLRNRRRFVNCSVVGNDSSMRDAALGGHRGWKHTRETRERMWKGKWGRDWGRSGEGGLAALFCVRTHSCISPLLTRRLAYYFS